MESAAARLSLGTGAPGAYFPVNRPWASGDQTICEIPERAHSGKSRAFRLAMQQRVLGLARYELLDPRQRERRLDAIDRPFGKADVSRLAGAHRARERLEGLLERRVVVIAMALIQIDIGHFEARQGGIELLLDLRARESPIRVAHREEQLGGQYHALARDARERLAEDALRLPEAVDVRGVEQRDAEIESAVNAGHGALLARGTGKRQP